MFYYVYKVTNKINNNYYIGKHKNNKPYDNSYMGSGKLIKIAITKYGIENFEKEILAVFDTNEAAALFEQTLVTKVEVASNKCYNMHEGGHGGFAHINSLPPNERPNIISFRAKILSGEISVGGTQHWTEESYQKVLAQSWGNKIKNGFDPDNFSKLSDEDKEKCRLRLSLSSTGNRNSQFGKRVFINLITNEKIKIKPELAPEGYHLYSEYKEEKLKDKIRWYNDGVINFRLKSTDEKVLNLTKGRIKTA